MNELTLALILLFFLSSLVLPVFALGEINPTSPSSVPDVIGQAIKDLWKGDAGDTGATGQMNMTMNLTPNMTSMAGYNVSSYLDFNETVAPPAPPADVLRIYAEPVHDFSLFSVKDSGGKALRILPDVSVVYNGGLITIPEYRAVFANGTYGDVSIVELAKSDSINTMPAIGLSIEDIAPGTYGRIIHSGLLENVSTGSFPAGDEIYISSTAAGLGTNVSPSYPNIKQSIGNVRVTGTGGAFQVIPKSMIYEPYLSHAGLMSLTTGDPHTQYVYPLGRSGGQVIYGGTDAGDDLVLNSTSSSTKGYVILAPDGTGRVGIGTMAPTLQFQVFRSAANAQIGIYSDEARSQISMRTNKTGGGTGNFINLVMANGTGSPPGKLLVGDRTGQVDGVGVSSISGLSITAAHIRFEIDGDVDTAGDSTDMPGRVTLYTTPDGSNGGVERMRINNQGNISIATTQGLATLQVNGTLLFPSLAGGTLTTDAYGNVYVVSDEKIKTEIKPLVSGLSTVLKVNPITFKFKPESGLDTKNLYSGFSADNLVSAGLTESVTAVPDYNYVQQCRADPVSGEEECIMVPVFKGTYTYAVNDRAVIGALVNAVKEENQIIQNQQGQITALEKRVAALEGKVGK